VLDEELLKLPERFRAPLVLCYLEGAARDEAARLLGTPLGTLKSRLERGRDLLHAALQRRGLTLSTGLAALLLMHGTSKACVPASLIQRTVQVALSLVAGGSAAGMVSSQVLQLANVGIGTMMLTTLKGMLVVILAAGFVVGAGVLTHRPQANKLAVVPQGNPSRLPVQSANLVSGRVVGRQGKGMPDADWCPRREFTYSIRAVVRVMPPVNLEALTDDYQDVRVRAETQEYVELEVVVYPLNTNAEAITANRNWKKDYAGMKEYLAPGASANWDDAMRQDLLRELAKAGIDPNQLSDKEVVEQVSRWLFQRCKYRTMFCTFYVGFRDGKPEVLPGLEKAFERDKGDPSWTVQQQWEHELLGKEMFANQSVGTCTSSAVLQTTVLRALGIPTRMIVCIPLADASDGAQVEMVEKGLTHNRVRRDVLLGLREGGSGFTSHTFCEVFIGGRWRRLNYTALGQNVLDRSCLGLTLHVHTFRDLSEANLAATWGTRFALGLRDNVFRHSNPYRLLEVSDHFGKHTQEPNPPLGELTEVTVGRAYWCGSKDVPASLQGPLGKRPGDGSGRLVFHGEEWLEDGDNYLQYKAFLSRANGEFILKAEGRHDVKASVVGSFYTLPAEGLHEIEVVIPPSEFAKMAKGVRYTAHPVNGRGSYRWKVRDGLTVTRE